ncbi:MAG: hypothetical protein K9K39_03255 [Desulfohalobiaceae bacterium]|nr:hypothetical protein [Desulfohalobiaceae bacterium]
MAHRICANPECRRKFEPKRTDQEHCSPKCRKQVYERKRTRHGHELINVHCEAPECNQTMRMTRVHARHLRKYYGDILCARCQEAELEKLRKYEGLRDPYEEGLFIPATAPVDPILVCPHG